MECSGEKQMAASVQMRLEAHAFVCDFAQCVEREYLKTAGICGSMARGQLMNLCKPPMRRDGLVTGSQVKMIGVGENDLRVESF